MKATSTPTYKSVGAALLQLTDQIDEELRDSDKPLDYIRLYNMAETICLLISDEEVKGMALKDFAEGFFKLEMAAYESPESAREIRYGAQKILIAMCNIAIVIASDRIDVEVARMAPLERQSKTKGLMITLARAQARRFWADDTRQEIRSGEMAEKVYKAMISLNLFEFLPGSADRLREWIKPEAPEYAQKGGRRKPSRT
ncbi:hypothetical protein NVV94_23565 [Pseudomonas sp. LS1212]|uniref:hypothetical protein n=1 Tax=Pseudomonas sp. LS1212 TaxID=2972478 RepID=UPI00215CFAFA|nr:hypothetical protein [Pseudomonas sp. LS1212]UVJ43492.1 hypothetical protein NVV94_23565 [Pseudomonas sp. LS1212]